MPTSVLPRAPWRSGIACLLWTAACFEPTPPPLGGGAAGGTGKATAAPSSVTEGATTGSAGGTTGSGFATGSTGGAGGTAHTGAADGTTGPADAGGGGLVMDLVETACAAAWVSGAGVRPCPADDMGDLSGAVGPVPAETGESPVPGTLAVATMPDYVVETGFIEGTYPAVVVPPGARLRGRVGCMAEADNCAFAWEVALVPKGGPPMPLAGGEEVLDGSMEVFDLPLDPWTGQEVQLLLHVDVGAGYSSHDTALWMAPQVVVPPP